MIALPLYRVAVSFSLTVEALTFNPRREANHRGERDHWARAEKFGAQSRPELGGM